MGFEPFGEGDTSNHPVDAQKASKQSERGIINHGAVMNTSRVCVVFKCISCRFNLELQILYAFTV